MKTNARVGKTKIAKKGWWVLALLVGGILLLGGCTFTNTMDIEPGMKDLPQPEKVPLRVGVYYSPEFRGYEHKRAYGSNMTIAPIGQASIKMFDQLLPSVFEQVVPITEMDSPASEGESVDAIIAPSIEAFDFKLGMDKEGPRFSVTYRISLYGKDTAPVSSWLINGKAEDPSTFPIYAHVEDDMRDAAGKFMASFRRPDNGGDAPFAVFTKKLNDMRTANAPHEKGVSVVSDSLTDKEELNAIYNQDTAGFGIVTLRVKLSNHNSAAMTMHPWAARLELPEGRSISPASPSAVISRFESPDHSGGVTAGAVGGIFGLLVTMSQESKRAKKRVELDKVLRSQGLSEAVLDQGDTAEGLLYFIPAKDTPAFDQAQLILWLNGSNKGAYRLEVPVEEIGFTGLPAKK